MPMELVHRPCGQANNGITPEAFAPLDGFKQIGMRAVGQFQIDRQRGIEIRQDLAHDRNKCETVSSELIELSKRSHRKRPS